MRALAEYAQHERLGGIGALGTVLLHGLAIGVIVFGRQPARRPPLPAYSVQLVAAPRAAVEADVATTGAETPSATRPSARPPVRPSVPSAPSARPPVRPSAAAAAASPNTNATPGTGTGPANIRTEGVEFPFPGYLRNLVAQVYRRWHPPSNNADLEAEMLFFVHRDGSVTGLQFVRRSGSFAFDLEAQGAVEAAARAGTFGSLPLGFGPDVLPVAFFFSPRSLR